MIIIADITGSHRSTETKFISALNARLHSTGATRALFIVHERQKGQIPSLFESVVVDDWHTPAKIANSVNEVLFRLLQESPDEVQLLSLHPSVLELTMGVP